ncbi:MAG: helicase C-terminal domain-containing protein [Solirubrobacterales bacterium]
MSLSTPEADALTKFAIERAKRALIISPSRTEINQIASRCVPDGVQRVTATDMEDGSEAFVSEESAVLLLANRYDGIDLPDESCRLIVLSGLPSAMHLQERFLFDRLRAHRVLAERVRTRIVQGSGRCTRNPQDYSAVIVRGEPLTDFCAKD